MDIKLAKRAGGLYYSVLFNRGKTFAYIVPAHAEPGQPRNWCIRQRPPSSTIYANRFSPVRVLDDLDHEIIYPTPANALESIREFLNTGDRRRWSREMTALLHEDENKTLTISEVQEKFLRAGFDLSTKALRRKAEREGVQIKALKYKSWTPRERAIIAKLDSQGKSADHMERIFPDRSLESIKGALYRGRAKRAKC